MIIKVHIKITDYIVDSEGTITDFYDYINIPDCSSGNELDYFIDQSCEELFTEFIWDNARDFWTKSHPYADLTNEELNKGWDDFLNKVFEESSYTYEIIDD